MALRDLAVSAEGPALIEAGVPFAIDVTVSSSGPNLGAGFVDVVLDLPAGLESTGTGVCAAGTGQVVCDDITDWLQRNTSTAIVVELVWTGAAGTGPIDVLVGVEDIETQSGYSVPLAEIDADVANNSTTLTLNFS
ncbi:MAG: hypothetical protein GY701_17870 [Sulfitobacter sp.]|nr:hypothetical protein [Sulfitobacter sp.]